MVSDTKIRHQNQLRKTAGIQGCNFNQAAGVDSAWNEMGIAAADYDNDGDTDILVTNSNGPAVLLRNDGTTANWLGVSLVGKSSNRR